MKTRLVPVLLVALVVLGGAASRAQAEDPAPSSASGPVLAQSFDLTDPAGVPAGMTVVFLPPAPDGFADGGDAIGDGMSDGGDAVGDGMADGGDGFADGGDGFADGGDAPVGFQWVVPTALPDGFADGGDAPVADGFVAALAQPAGDDFWDYGVVPDGLVAVLAWVPPDGFADGGDLPAGYVPVLFATNNSNSVITGG
jgi:hypothetical protein